jgi:hypothetical protein
MVSLMVRVERCIFEFEDQVHVSKFDVQVRMQTMSGEWCEILSEYNVSKCSRSLSLQL